MDGFSLEDLEGKCQRCDGKGHLEIPSFGRDREITCDDCRGSGLAPTELGEKFLDFIKRNLSLQLSARIS